MAENDRSISGFIKAQSSAKFTEEIKVLDKVTKTIKDRSTESGPVCEIIDIIFSVTGYGEANVPGGESHIFGEIISKIVQYAQLRAHELQNPESRPNNENLENSLRDMVMEGARLYAESTANRKLPTVVKG